MVKKVVALEDCWISKIIEKENYVAYSLDSETFTILNDRGFYYKTLKQKFKQLEKEMEIKVGSEWVTNGGKTVRIKYVGHTHLIYEDLKNTDEQAQTISFFKAAYKPAPVRRTVWLNVYNGCCLSYGSKDDADKNKVVGLLFQQEVELIDPRGGERNG